MTLVVAALAPGKAPGWCVTVNIGGAGVLNILLKNIIQRPRPDGFRLVAESGYSFPSGHSMISMAFFGLVIWMVWHYHKDDVMRYVWCAVFGLIIALVGISRIYLGVHYASDVIAGFCVSIIWLVFYTKIIAPLFMPDLPVRKSAQKQISPSP
jgi:undecaprenyl-diphosphatase